MAERPPTLLQLHLEELRGRYSEACKQGMKALRDDDLEGFGAAVQQQRAIYDEWTAVLENYFENHVRRRLQPPRTRRTPERVKSAGGN